MPSKVSQSFNCCKYKHIVSLIYQTQNKEFKLLKSTNTSSQNFTKPNLYSIYTIKQVNLSFNPLISFRTLRSEKSVRTNNLFFCHPITGHTLAVV
ncbi:uncharacterized protein DS421_2g39370 [Arachis hypogaea]|nr:uncharacterized protein DS421_2g39370 [Arachis hypogaea]